MMIQRSPQVLELGFNLIKSYNYMVSKAAAVEAFKERHDETQFTTKIGGKTSLGLSYFVL
jgi:hypothetical protein